MKAEQIAENTWALEQGDVRSFVLAGQTAALVIDTGVPEPGFAAAVRGLTDLPTTLVNTHHHYDHTGNNRDFPEAWVHEKDLEPVAQASTRALPLAGGHVFELGGRQVEAVFMGGHTPGSIALLDRANRLLFTGDLLSDVPVWMNGPDSDFPDYMDAMDKLQALRGKADHIFACHGSLETSFDRAMQLKEAALQYMTGKLSPKTVTLDEADGPMTMVRYDGCSFFV